MKRDNKIIIAIIAFAVIFTVFGAGAFLITVPADKYYDYSLGSVVPSENAMSVTVDLQEKSDHKLSTCPLNVPYGGAQQCARAQPPCASKTNLNARSIRVLIDGNEVANAYTYPTSASPDSNTTSFAINSPLTEVGAVCCWGAETCSVCYDQEYSNKLGQRAYVFTADKGAQAVLTGNLFTIVFDSQNYAAGNHTVDVYFYSETLFQDPTACDNQGIRLQDSQINGWTAGEQNTKYNTHVTGTFEVAGASDGSGGTGGDTIAPPPPIQTNGIIIAFAVVAAGFFVYTAFVKIR